MAVLYTEKDRVSEERFVKWKSKHQGQQDYHVIVAGNGAGSGEAEVPCYPSLL